MGNSMKNSRNRSRGRNRSGASVLFSDEAKALAREVVTEAADEEVGEHLGISMREGMAVHRFASLTPGYSGWEWVVVLTTVPGSGVLTINEVTLQAGDKAHLPPKWVPYEDRVQPGDLRPGALLPPRHGDERLSSEPVADVEGFPRNERAELQLSEKGLRDANKRWRATYGRGSVMARQAEWTCDTCAFFLPIAENAVRYGVCANEYSADGRVVDYRYGCGAHSATKEEAIGRTNKDYGAFDDGI